MVKSAVANVAAITADPSKQVPWAGRSLRCARPVPARPHLIRCGRVSETTILPTKTPLNKMEPADLATTAAIPDDDDALMLRFSNGDRMAAAVLTDRLTPGVLALATRMLGDRGEAEDVAQDAMMRLWQTAAQWEPGRAKPSTWLYRVTANLCTDRLRKRRSVGLDAAPEPEDEGPSAVRRLETEDRAKALNAALATLPERQRTALHLRHFEELGQAEIAEIMETSIEAIESLLGRGKRALAAALKPKQTELGLT